MDRRPDINTKTRRGQFNSSPEATGLFMVYLVLAGISALFVALTFAYVFGDKQAIWGTFNFPKLFWLSTMLVGLSSFMLYRAMQAYEQDNVTDLRRLIFSALLLGFGFVAAQIGAWYDMSAMGIKFTTTPSGSYLYLISGLHAIHVIAGVIFLLFCLRSVIKYTRDEVSSLLFFADPHRKRRLQMAFVYWHTVGVIWFYLFLFFLYNHSYPENPLSLLVL